MDQKINGKENENASGSICHSANLLTKMSNKSSDLPDPMDLQFKSIKKKIPSNLCFTSITVCLV